MTTRPNNAISVLGELRRALSRPLACLPVFMTLRGTNRIQAMGSGPALTDQCIKGAQYSSLTAPVVQ
jgi:hypothetical protein